jgi:hypothetical protein
MIKKYTFCYDDLAEVKFTVDIDIFTVQKAKDTLGFFMWDYNEDGNLIDEVMKKYALECIIEASYNDYNKLGLIKEFNEKEGFYSIDGKYGITLDSIESYEFSEDKLEMIVS